MYNTAVFYLAFFFVSLAASAFLNLLDLEARKAVLLIFNLYSRKCFAFPTFIRSWKTFGRWKTRPFYRRTFDINLHDYCSFPYLFLWFIPWSLYQFTHWKANALYYLYYRLAYALYKSDGRLHLVLVTCDIIRKDTPKRERLRIGLSWIF